jgi:hypothetical protein
VDITQAAQDTVLGPGCIRISVRAAFQYIFWTDGYADATFLAPSGKDVYGIVFFLFHPGKLPSLFGYDFKQYVSVWKI